MALRTCELRFSKKFSSVLWRKCLNPLNECGLLFFTQLRRGRRTRGHRYPNLHEEFLLSRRGADTEHSYRTTRNIVKLVWSIGGDIQGVAGAHDRVLATERCLHFPFEQDKGLFEVMPMRWRPAAWRDVHINYAESSICVVARHGDRVGIADETDVREVVGLPQREISFGVVWRDR